MRARYSFQEHRDRPSTKRLNSYQSPKYAPPFRSTIHVPFYTEDSNGILSVGTTEKDAYSEDDFKFLFDLGSQIAPTLGRVTT
jgi:hypothetical protein